MIQILGLPFFNGSAELAATQVREGGLLVAPSAPGLKDLPKATRYREALLNADIVLPDSGLMVLVWNLLKIQRIKRLSGLEFIRYFLLNSKLPESPMFWIMPSEESAQRAAEWLTRHGYPIDQQYIHVAPYYGDNIEDNTLLEKLRILKPKHIIVGLGGGTQEPLGNYLKVNLFPKPAIYCIGAAIGFLTGDQVAIPRWADRCYLGWLFRCINNPRRFIPRYYAAISLIPLLLKYRGDLPTLKTRSKHPTTAST